MIKKVFTPLQQAIIDSWKKTVKVHPSYGSIAKQLGCSPDTVYRTVQIYLELKKGKSDAK
jgi:translation initiation factor 2 alpha subunit (eIF-2alpha)